VALEAVAMVDIGTVLSLTEQQEVQIRAAAVAVVLEILVAWLAVQVLLL
jgi:hypothetical protein